MVDRSPAFGGPAGDLDFGVVKTSGGVDVDEGSGAAPDILRKRERHEVGLRRAVPVRTDRRRLADDHQLFGMRHGKRAEEQRMHDRERRGVRADPEPEQQHDRERERWLLPERPTRISRVLDELFQQDGAARVASLFFRSLQAAERDMRLALRLHARHAAPRQFLGFPFKVEAQLGVEIVLHRRSPEDGP